jgi:hypothetical protein
MSMTLPPPSLPPTPTGRNLVDRVPTGADALLAVEVSDTTQGDDLGFKVSPYARAGVEEYRVLDLSRRVLVAFRESRDGEYTRRDEFAENDTIFPVCVPDSPVRVADLIG